MKVVLIDGNNLGWRAFAQAPLSFNGKRTEVLKIGLAIIRSYLEQFEPDYLAVAWDGGRDVRRTEKYPEYKRKKKVLTEVEKRERTLFFEQLDVLKKALYDFGIAQFCIRGCEADDVLYSLVCFKEFDNSEITIVSTDEDMFQLFHYHSNLKVYSPIQKITYTRESVQEKFQIPIDFFMLYKALSGCSSDNIPGIHGIGPAASKIYIDILDKSKLYESLTKNEKKIYDKIGDQNDVVNLMLDLVCFKDIPRQTLMDNKREIETITVDELYSHVLKTFTEYGFDTEKRFGYFISQFEMYLKRKKVI